MIEVPYKYSVTSSSLQNFLVNNYYSEEIINSLLILYQEHSSTNGYLVFDTFTYHTVYKLVKNPNKQSDCSVIISDLDRCKAVIFPILITEPYNEVVVVIASPNEKTICLNHYNSRQFKDSKNKTALKLMHNIAKYIEAHLIPQAEEGKQKDNDSTVSFVNVNILAFS